jgi:hypothetical protein
VLQVFQRVLPSDNVGFFIDKVRSVITQEYRGDITLIPPRRLNHLFSLLTSHSIEEEAEFIEIGARLTWPNLEMIKNTTSVSRTFRQCLERVRARNGGGTARSRGRRG